MYQQSREDVKQKSVLVTYRKHVDEVVHISLKEMAKGWKFKTIPFFGSELFLAMESVRC